MSSILSEENVQIRNPGLCDRMKQKWVEWQTKNMKDKLTLQQLYKINSEDTRSSLINDRRDTTMKLIMIINSIYGLVGSFYVLRQDEKVQLALLIYCLILVCTWVCYYSSCLAHRKTSLFHLMVVFYHMRVLVIQYYLD